MELAAPGRVNVTLPLPAHTRSGPAMARLVAGDGSTVHIKRVTLAPAEAAGRVAGFRYDQLGHAGPSKADLYRAWLVLTWVPPTICQP